MNALDLLTINGEKLLLQKQVIELKEKAKDNDYIIKRKLQGKDDEMNNIKQQMLIMQQEQKEMHERLTRQFNILSKVVSSP